MTKHSIIHAAKKAIINKKFALKEIENLIEKIKKERLYLETLKANNTDQNLCDIREYEINCKIRDLITVCEFLRIEANEVLYVLDEE